MTWKQMLSALVVLAAAALGGLRPAAAADERLWMGETAIRAELTNRKLTGVYPSGVPWSEVISTDGTTDYEEAGIRSRGRWTLSGSVFCFTYDLPLAGGCFRMIKVGGNCYELYVESDATRRSLPPPREAVAWNGRMWRAAERSTCEDGVS